MKRFILIILVIFVISIFCTSCGNMNIIDTTWSFEEAYIKMPNGDVIHGKVTSWDDYENSDMVQVTIDGKTYLTHSCNVVLVSTD